jgi:inactive STAND
MYNKDHLHTDIDALEKQCDILSQKKGKLREELAWQSDVCIKFQIEKQIEQVQEEQKEIHRQICNFNSCQLYRNLLKLGYTKQEMLFLQFIRKHPVSAFLIHGEPDYGQGWLLNRLSLHIKGSIKAKKVIVDLSCLVRSKNIDVVWRDIARSVGLGRQVLPPEIVDRVYLCLQTQSVFIIFTNIDFVPPKDLRELLHNLWLLFASKTQKISSESKLLMFMVDMTSNTEKCDIQFAERLNTDWNANIPIKLPIIERFNQDILSDWIKYEFASLPTELTDNIDSSIQTILEQSEKFKRMVYKIY